jgi:hypothetical protein
MAVNPASAPMRPSKSKCRDVSKSDGLDVDGLGTLRAVFYIELNGLALLQRFESAARDSGVVDKNVGALVGLDESKPFGFVEPFHLPGLHGKFPPFLVMMVS